jgi:5-formyltetrahydrofolate cyclo-ligase
MGGGFYDRSFAFKKGPGRRKKPVLIGIAYQFQQVDELPRQPWDVPLDAVVTDTHLKKLN